VARPPGSARSPQHPAPPSAAHTRRSAHEGTHRTAEEERRGLHPHRAPPRHHHPRHPGRRRRLLGQGRVRPCKATKTGLATALEAYYAKNNAYPADLGPLKVDGFISDFGGTPLPDDKNPTSIAGTDKKDQKNSWSVAYTPGDPYDLKATFGAANDPC
jgi:hypothetical protein